MTVPQPIAVADVETRPGQVLRDVRDRHVEYLVVEEGKPVARIAPPQAADERDGRLALLDEIESFAREIGQRCAPGLSAADAVAEARR
jgi:antitoxin (DNA-binding transcriptional repressor) of toxin-antitoxin stability system